MLICVKFYRQQTLKWLYNWKSKNVKRMRSLSRTNINMISEWLATSNLTSLVATNLLIIMKLLCAYTWHKRWSGWFQSVTANIFVITIWLTDNCWTTLGSDCETGCHFSYSIKMSEKHLLFVWKSPMIRNIIIELCSSRP